MAKTTYGTITRKFNGKQYKLHSQHDYYAGAERARDFYKTLGYKARIVVHRKAPHPYWIFVSK